MGLFYLNDCDSEGKQFTYLNYNLIKYGCYTAGDYQNSQKHNDHLSLLLAHCSPLSIRQNLEELSNGLFLNGFHPCLIILSEPFMNRYLHKIGVLDSSACECGFPNETVLHYICYCPLYATEREELVLALSGLTIFTLDNVLCGSNECSEGENYAFIDAVLFIKQTKWFIQT